MAAHKKRLRVGGPEAFFSPINGALPSIEFGSTLERRIGCSDHQGKAEQDLHGASHDAEHHQASGEKFDCPIHDILLFFVIAAQSIWADIRGASDVKAPARRRRLRLAVVDAAIGFDPALSFGRDTAARNGGCN